MGCTDYLSGVFLFTKQALVLWKLYALLQKYNAHVAISSVLSADYSWKISQEFPVTLKVHTWCEIEIQDKICWSLDKIVSFDYVFGRKMNMHVLSGFNTLQWRHNKCGGVSNHRRLDCLLNRLFGRRSKKTSKLRITGLCKGNPPVTGGFPSQRASTAENVSIWWRHHGVMVRNVNPSSAHKMRPDCDHQMSNHHARPQTLTNDLYIVWHGF